MVSVRFLLNDGDALALARLAKGQRRTRSAAAQVIVEEYIQTHGLGYLITDPDPDPEPEPAIPDAAIDDDIEERVRRAAQKKVGE